MKQKIKYPSSKGHKAYARALSGRKILQQLENKLNKRKFEEQQKLA